MTTIVLAKPSDRHPRWQVFGVWTEPEDGFTFGLRELEEQKGLAAEQYARRMMEKHQADHFERA